jgi:hypothetical protein
VGRRDHRQLIDARVASLNELLAGWEPEQHAELERMVDELARDLAARIPTPEPA